MPPYVEYEARARADDVIEEVIEGGALQTDAGECIHLLNSRLHQTDLVALAHTSSCL